jgi:transcriptional regulator with XRE-family HTH domain
LEVRLITIEQLRAARGLLGWSQTDLAARAGLSLPTVKRLEAGFGPHVSDEARAKLQKALEAAGIEFIDDNGGGAGVRFRKSRLSKRK